MLGKNATRALHPSHPFSGKRCTGLARGSPHLSLKIFVHVVQSRDVGSTVANHELSQSPSKVIDDGVGGALRGDVTLPRASGGIRGQPPRLQVGGALR